MDNVGNKGAFLKFTSPALEPEIVQFTASPHPNDKPMQYAKNFFF